MPTNTTRPSHAVRPYRCRAGRLALWFCASFLLASPLMGVAHADLRYAGSSTVGEHVMVTAVEAFYRQTGLKFAPLDMRGSGRGLIHTLDGHAHLAGVSRALKPAELARRPYYQVIGYDAIGVYVNAANPVTRLNAGEVEGIFTGRFRNWREVGGPDQPIVCITEILGQKRATMLAFQDLAMGGKPYLKARVELDRPRHQIDRLAKSPWGIATVSMAFVRPGVRAVRIGRILPSARAIRSGAYPYSRPLLLVSAAVPSGDLERFYKFMLGSDGQRLVGRNFVPIVSEVVAPANGRGSR